jgi:hypothetical protein
MLFKGVKKIFGAGGLVTRQRRPYIAARTPPMKKVGETFDAPPRKLGRPSDYTPELGFQISQKKGHDFLSNLGQLRLPYWSLSECRGPF